MNTYLSRGRRFKLLGASCVWALLAGIGGSALPLFVTTAQAVECPPSKKELADVMNAAIGLLKQNKGADAIAKLKEADGMQKTACELGEIDQLKLGGAIRSANAPLAAKTFESLASTFTPAQAQPYLLAISSFYLQDHNYTETVSWANRYLSSGGPDVAHAKANLAAAYQAGGDYANLQKITLDQISQRESAGSAPAENDLDMLLFTSDKLKDAAHHSAAEEKLVTFYPSPDHWAFLLHEVVTRPTFARTRLQLDVLRLQFATGNLTKAEQFTDYIELAVQSKSPGEAKSVADKGFEIKALGTGPEAARHGRFRDLIQKKLDEMQAVEAQTESDAKAAKTGDAAVDIGMFYYGLGKFDLATSWIEQGIAKGGLKNPGDAKLHLGIVYLAAGQKAKAIDILKSIKDTDGAADLARMWVIKAGGRL